MEQYGNAAYESNWYNQSPKNQKLLILLIARAQKPNIFMGYKMIYCSLEAFGKVNISLNILMGKSSNRNHFHFIFQLNKTAATYYMLFRNLSMK